MTLGLMDTKTDYGISIVRFIAIKRAVWYDEKKDGDIMKVKLLVWLGQLILGKAFSDDEPRADMYMPVWLLAFSLLLLVAGVALSIYAIVSLFFGVVLAAVFCLLFGAAAFLCWKNQTIRMLSDDVFVYTTFLGNEKTYRFSQIKGLKRNNDSMTLFVGDGKVHIESSACITSRLAARINRQLEELYNNGQ